MAKKTNGRGALHVYKTYNFVDKDPIIDYCRSKFEDSGLKYSDVEKKTGGSGATYRGWFHGRTRRPQFHTTARLLLACGERNLDLRAIERMIRR